MIPPITEKKIGRRYQSPEGFADFSVGVVAINILVSGLGCCFPQLGQNTPSPAITDPQYTQCFSYGIRAEPQYGQCLMSLGYDAKFPLQLGQTGALSPKLIS